jgi:AraC family L-rhamnose operon transcriptional activator RhaR
MDWINRMNGGIGRIDLDFGVRIEVLHWCYQAALEDNLPHSHTFYEICLVGRQGSGQFMVENEPHRIRSGDLFIARPKVAHQILNDKRHLELYWMGFRECGKTSHSSSEIATLWRRFAENDRCVVTPSPRAAALWRDLRGVSEGPYRAGQNEQIRALVKVLLLAILQDGAGEDALYAEPSQPSAAAETAVRIAMQFMKDNMTRPLKTEDIARQTHLSPRHLSRLFIAQSGTTPMRYLENLRVEHAASLLRHTSLPIKAVAAQSGFVTVQYFTRVFQKKMGCAPGSYRESRDRG